MACKTVGTRRPTNGPAYSTEIQQRTPYIDL